MNDTLAYALADSLNMALEAGVSDPKLRGSDTFTVDIAGMGIPFAVRVVSALVERNKHMIIAKCQGNLALFLAAVAGKKGEPDVTLLILNLAKMTNPAGFLEKVEPASEKIVERLLEKAVVKKYRKEKNKWIEIAR